MKPIKCEVWEPYDDCIKVTYYNSIRKAIKYCRNNGLSSDDYIYIKDGNMISGTVYWSWKMMDKEEKRYLLDFKEVKL